MARFIRRNMFLTLASPASPGSRGQAAGRRRWGIKCQQPLISTLANYAAKAS